MYPTSRPSLFPLGKTNSPPKLKSQDQFRQMLTQAKTIISITQSIFILIKSNFTKRCKIIYKASTVVCCVYDLKHANRHDIYDISFNLFKSVKSIIGLMCKFKIFLVIPGIISIKNAAQITSFVITITREIRKKKSTKNISKLISSLLKLMRAIVGLMLTVYFPSMLALYLILCFIVSIQTAISGFTENHYLNALDRSLKALSIAKILCY